MNKIEIKEIGEHQPQKRKTKVTINKLKEFSIIPYFIRWYKSSQSNKVFPIFLQELSDLNPSGFKIPGVLTRNPFFDHAQIKYFIAFKNKMPAGRIMAFIDYNYNKAYNKNVGIIGCFESIEERDVAFSLFESAIKYFRANRCDCIMGPAKFNASGEIGLLIDGFEFKPYVLEPYNAPYYKDFFESFGFKKENDWFSVNTDNFLSSSYMDKFERIQNLINGNRRGNILNGFNIRNADFKKLDDEIEIIKKLYNKIWNEGNHPQQLELTDDEFRVLAAGIKSISVEDFIFIAEKDGNPVGVSVNIPDINEVIDEYDRRDKNYFPSKNFFSIKDFRRDIQVFNKIQDNLRNKRFTRIRCFILGVLKEYRKTGLDSRLYFLIKQTAKKYGVTHGSGSQLADINMDIINPLSKLGKRTMTWRVYNMDL